MSLFTKRVKRENHSFKKSEGAICSFLSKKERFARKTKERIPNPTGETRFLWYEERYFPPTLHQIFQLIPLDGATFPQSAEEFSPIMELSHAKPGIRAIITSAVWALSSSLNCLSYFPSSFYKRAEIIGEYCR